MSNPYNNKELLSKVQRKAKKLGVIVKPSTRKNKKLDVFKNDKKIASIGDTRYKDFLLYSQEDKKKAKKRRLLYRLRHAKDLKNSKKGPGYYAYYILW
jgi:hypothetical protein